MSKAIAKAAESITPKVLNHFKKHWWKWVLTGTMLGFAWSGYSYKNGDFEFKKTAPFKQKVGINDSNTV